MMQLFGRALRTRRLRVDRASGRGPLEAVWLLVVVWVGLVWPRGLQAQLPDALKQKLTLTSVSQQFVIHADRDAATGLPKHGTPGEAFTYNVGVGPPLTLFALKRGGATNVIEVDPKMLAVTCERVKKVVLEELGLPDRWRGRIQVFVAPPSRRFQPVDIVPARFADGWQYRVAVPAECDWQRLVRGLVEVLLLEIINRHGGLTLAQSPLWLSEGLSTLLIAENGRTLVTEPNAYLTVSGRKVERLRLARERFRLIEPMSFTQLGQPEVSQLGVQDAWEDFQANAQLLTHELLAEEGGRARLVGFMQGLPQLLNWQTAFLRAYQPRFQTLLDVERWWAVAAADFMNRDPTLQWSREKVLLQLDGLLRENSELRSGTNGPVSRQEWALSEIVAQWEYAPQREVLQRKAGQLQVLHLHTPPDLRPLVADCFRTIDEYLNGRGAGANRYNTRGGLEPRSRLLSREASRRLAALEARVASLKPRGG